jgi:polar amino acid transport system substrate-binding protein
MAHFQEIAGIYSEAFKRLGYRFTLVSLPGERSLVDANSGVVDGEALRISHLDSHKYPNLIQVLEPVKVLKDGAYAVDPSIKIDGWESLRGKGYKVGIFKGIKSFEKKLPLYVKKENIIALSGFEQILKMLQARRIDIYIAATIMEESAPMKSDKYKDIVRVGIVEEKAGYPWLHKRHKKLLSPLADTLKAIKADGTFQKIIEAAKQK